MCFLKDYTSFTAMQREGEKKDYKAKQNTCSQQLFNIYFQKQWLFLQKNLAVSVVFLFSNSYQQLLIYILHELLISNFLQQFPSKVVQSQLPTTNSTSVLFTEENMDVDRNNIFLSVKQLNCERNMYIHTFKQIQTDTTKWQRKRNSNNLK